jgi:hypothetical protein
MERIKIVHYYDFLALKNSLEYTKFPAGIPFVTPLLE